MFRKHGFSASVPFSYRHHGVFPDQNEVMISQQKVLDGDIPSIFYTQKCMSLEVTFRKLHLLGGTTFLWKYFWYMSPNLLTPKLYIYYHIFADILNVLIYQQLCCQCIVTNNQLSFVVKVLFVSQYCQPPLTGWLKPQTLISSEFWMLKVQNQGVRRDCFCRFCHGLSSWIADGTFFLCFHMIFPPHTFIPGISFCGQISSYKDISQIRLWSTLKASSK